MIEQASDDELSDERIEQLYEAAYLGHEMHREHVAFARAIEREVASRRPAVAAAPEGMKLVPIEPTQQMLDSGFRGFTRFHKLFAPADDAIRMVWDFMLAALAFIQRSALLMRGREEMTQDVHLAAPHAEVATRFSDEALRPVVDAAPSGLERLR